MILKTAHCAYDIHYHLVIVMKYRKKLLLKPEYIEYLCNLIKEIAEHYEFIIEEFGSDGNHLHILLSSPPRYSPSQVMQIIKSITARKMFSKYPELRKQLWGAELWSDGGYVGTIGQAAGLEHMKIYIKNQGDNNKNHKMLEYLTSDTP